MDIMRGFRVTSPNNANVEVLIVKRGTLRRRTRWFGRRGPAQPFIQVYAFNQANTYVGDMFETDEVVASVEGEIASHMLDWYDELLQLEAVATDELPALLKSTGVVTT